jgi:hypothetical protein
LAKHLEPELIKVRLTPFLWPGTDAASALLAALDFSADAAVALLQEKVAGLDWETGDRLRQELLWEVSRVAKVRGRRAALSSRVIESLGDRQYRLEGHAEIVAVSITEDNLLQAFIGRPAMMKKELQARSGLKEKAAAIFLRMQKRYASTIGRGMTAPHGRGKGGYRAMVRKVRAPLAL